MTETHKTELEAAESFLKDFDYAHSKDLPWMAAVWYVENGRLVLHRTSHAFPIMDFPISVKLLEANLKNSQGIDRSPLPLADHIKKEDDR